MEVIRRGTVLNNGGCHLIQEDWSNDYPSIHKPGDQLAAYPVASVSGGPYNYYRRGKSFRLGMYFPSVEEANAAFYALEHGTAKLQDYVEFFDTVPGEHKEDILEYLR